MTHIYGQKILESVKTRRSYSNVPTGICSAIIGPYLIEFPQGPQAKLVAKTDKHAIVP